MSDPRQCAREFQHLLYVKRLWEYFLPCKLSFHSVDLFRMKGNNMQVCIFHSQYTYFQQYSNHELAQKYSSYMDLRIHAADPATSYCK